MSRTNRANERGRSVGKQLVVCVLTPAVIAFGALVVAAAPASAESVQLPSVMASAIATVPTITIEGAETAFSSAVTTTLSGTSTGAAGRRVIVYVAGLALPATTSPAGDWSVESKIVEGKYQVVAAVWASNGLRVTASQSLTVDRTAPVIVITGGAAKSIRAATTTVSGRVDLPAGSKIKVVVDEVALVVVVSSTGTWSVTSPSLTAGTHTVVVSATDSAGNTGTAQQRLTVAPVLSIDGGKSHLTNNATPTISGTTDAPAGTTVAVTGLGQTLSTTVTAAGTWSLTPHTLRSIAYPMVVSVRDAAGNVVTAQQALIVDAIAPVMRIEGGQTVSTTSHTPTISGTTDAPAGSTITVALDGIAHDVVVSSTGTWSLTFPSLKVGRYTVDVSATDAAGNTGTAQQRLTVIPVLSIDGGAVRLTNDPNATISGTTDAPVGTPVTVWLSRWQMLTGTVTAEGTWAVTPPSLFSSTFDVRATVPDAAGSAQSAHQDLTVDIDAPVIVMNGGSAVSTWTATPTISGRVDLPAGSKIKVTVDAVAVEAIVSPTGTWSVTSASLRSGAHAVVVSATDPAGNVGTQQQKLTVLVLSIDGGASRITNNATPTIDGTLAAPAGTAVTVTLGGQTLTGTVTAAGSWSVTPTSLGSAPYSVKASVRDAAGNVHTAWQNLTVDTVAPAIVIDGGPTVSTGSHTPTISGRTDLPAGSKIRVAVDENAQEVAVSATRTWSTTSPSLTVGTHLVAVSGTDPAGNAGTQRQRLTVVPVLSVDGGASRLTNDATPTISGTTDAPFGTSVAVTGLGQTLSGTVTETGTWSVTAQPFPSTAYSLLASVPDAAGHVRTARQSLTIDAIAPAIVIDGGSAVSTRTATPTISGRTDLPAGSKIKVAVDDVAQEVAVSSTRTWSVTSQTLKAGAHTVVVSATDAAGNEGTQRQRLTLVG